MKIASVKLTGFRNFASTSVNLSEKTLVIGANDVGKTNFIYALRLLLDSSIAEPGLQPRESDFHIPREGAAHSEIRIELKLSGIVEDAVISRLKGYISDVGETFLVYTAHRASLSYELFIGHSLESCEQIDGRSYLKHIHFNYIESCRDINEYIQREKRDLLKIAKQKRSAEEEAADLSSESDLQSKLGAINDGINKLNYVAGATASINDELKSISHHNADYAIGLEAQSLNFASFVERLSLGASTSGKHVGLGGDGRNNQILVGLWKAKSEVKHDVENEAIIYCIEEPEAHLHPHQQRKLASYLMGRLKGQVFVSTHSPQITSEFRPDSVVRLLEKEGSTVAASGGCSPCIEEAWKSLSYRMSILPAEAFFADAVLLVEGPSEVLFYQALARQLQIDLDFHNVSVLSVDGIAFKIYAHILRAMEIPFVARTDNDILKVPYSDPPMWQFAGLNRALGLVGMETYDHHSSIDTQAKLRATWTKEMEILNPLGIYVSKWDLENDLAEVCGEALKTFSKTKNTEAAVKYMQDRKAIRMNGFLAAHANVLKELRGDYIASPLYNVVMQAEMRRAVAQPARK